MCYHLWTHAHRGRTNILGGVMMNDLIEKLAQQAGIVFWEISGDVDWRQANRENLEKFAELIVNECVKKSVEICMDRFQGDCWKNNKEDIEALRCSQDIQRLLPKYFGVEE